MRKDEFEFCQDPITYDIKELAALEHLKIDE